MKNLLDNLLNIRTEIEIPLEISIDNGGNLELNKVVEDFVWPFGEKTVTIHSHKLGLVKHFIWAGDQTERFEHVLFLEDDLLVSPEIINYSLQLIQFYENDDNIAAASLYNPVLTEATGTKFYQLQDEFDVYFLQQPYWGNIWFKDKWRKFKKYLETYEEKPELLPCNVASWDRSFKKMYIQFLVETNRTIVTPKVSVVTNNGVAGIHGGDMYAYQSQLQLEAKTYTFPTLKQSKSRYDCYEEIESDILAYYNNELSKYEFCVDLLGTKTTYNKPYVLTTRPSRNPILSYSSLMKPTELSIILNVKGDSKVVLSRIEDIIQDSQYEKKRRYNDILKNYHIGLNAGFYITKYFFRTAFNMLLSKVINR
ncbi:MAG: hypothetical protein IJA24_02275 [Alistipes sp.]|nr:hypothetical protein [Alistipes sp.]